MQIYDQGARETGIRGTKGAEEYARKMASKYELLVEYDSASEPVRGEAV